MRQFSSASISKLFCVALLTFITVGLLGCESDEDNKLASAQACLDTLTQTSSTASAQACESKVSGLTTPESYVIRCSVGFFVGGVRENTIVNAYIAYEAATGNLKTAALMGGLSMSGGSNAANIAQANLTYSHCEKSEVPSLIYMASLSQMGTLVTNSGGSPSSDPATFLATCSNGGSGGVCNDTLVGTALTTLYDSSCMGSLADSVVCQKAKSAIQASGGNPANVAIQLYALLQ